MVGVDVGVPEVAVLLICYDPLGPYLWASGGQTDQGWTRAGAGERDHPAQTPGMEGPQYSLLLTSDGKIGHHTTTTTTLTVSQLPVVRYEHEDKDIFII